MLFTIAIDTITEITPSNIEIPTPHRAALPTELAFFGALSFSVRYIIKPTIGIKNDIMFKPVDGTSFEFKLTSSEIDSFLDTAGNFFSIKSETPNKIKAIFVNGQTNNGIIILKPFQYSNCSGMEMRLYINCIKLITINKIPATFFILI